MAFLFRENWRHWTDGQTKRVEHTMWHPLEEPHNKKMKYKDCG